MWCLGQFLPITIGDAIPDGYTYWENYLTHLDIIDEVFAPVTNTERIDYVGMPIEDFLEEFNILYPERSLTSKMHYLVHIPTWMNRYTHIQYFRSLVNYDGPPILLYTATRAL